MAKVKKNTATIAVYIAVAAVIVLAAILFLVSPLMADDDPYANESADRGMRFNYMNVDIEWSDDRSCKVTQELQFEVLDYLPTHGIYVDIPVNSGEKVRDLEVSCALPYSFGHEGHSLVRITVGDAERTLIHSKSYDFKMTYTYLTPVHESPDVLALMAIGQGWKNPVRSANVTMTYPAAPASTGGDYGIWIGGKRLENTPYDAVWSDGGRTVTLSDISLEPFEGVEIAYPMPTGLLKERSNTDYVVTLVVGLILVATVLVFEFVIAKNKPLTPIVDYYPPRVKSVNGSMRHMLPVQMGKIIDDSCSNEDVTSLIFYWASEGYIEIDEKDGDTILIRKSDVMPVATYERRLFDKLFQNATENEDGELCASVEELSGKFANAITETRTAVNAEYKGKLYKKNFTTVSVAMTVLCALYGLLMPFIASLRIAKGFFNPIGAVALIPVLLAAALGYAIAKRYFKFNIAKRRVLLVGYAAIILLLAFGVSMVIPTDVMGMAEKIMFAVLIAIPSTVAPFLIVRTDEYNEMLNSILGFRDFLRDAEKDRLETLLADDPQYYYNILPYANVLGVSDIWEKKFEDLTVPPPTYYRSNTTLFDIYIMHRLMRNVRTSLTFVPPKASSGSFSGFGRGGGGGGFSGGSFGGGGGGRW